jgi:hypothetical protein
MGEAIDYSITDHLVTNHFLVSLLITDHPTSLFELRRASWLPTYAEAPAGKLITDHWPLITVHRLLITDH